MSLRNYDDLRKILPSTFIYEPILMRICIDAIFVKTQKFYRYAKKILNKVHKTSKVIEGHLFIYRFTFSQVYFLCSNSILLKFDDMKFDLIITLTYVLMDNFCPCFFINVDI